MVLPKSGGIHGTVLGGGVGAVTKDRREVFTNACGARVGQCGQERKTCNGEQAHDGYIGEALVHHHDRVELVTAVSLFRTCR